MFKMFKAEGSLKSPVAGKYVVIVEYIIEVLISIKGSLKSPVAVKYVVIVEYIIEVLISIITLNPIDPVNPSPKLEKVYT